MKQEAEKVLEGYFGNDLYLLKERDDLQYIVRAMHDFATYKSEKSVLEERERIRKEIEKRIAELKSDSGGRVVAPQIFELSLVISLLSPTSKPT